MFAPLPEARVLRSGRQIPRLVRDQADRKKAPNSTPINSASKRDRAPKTGGVDPERSGDIRPLPRKQVRRNETPLTGPTTDSHAGSQCAEVQKPLSKASSPVSPLPEASGSSAMSA